MATCYTQAMKIQMILREVAHRTGTTQRSLADQKGITKATISKQFQSSKISLELFNYYLNQMGYSIYVVPDSIDMKRYEAEAIKVEAE